ncbi:MAG TPA: hypothetical protein H9795_10335 [Candidatus Fournierella merdigallinarum]|nr:hypothetical protein [Candidatus Fournierella merdigallinarum]
MEGNTTITVAGVRDVTAPENLAVSYGTDKFKELLNDITFGLFFKETVTVTFSATDAGSGVASFTYTLGDDGTEQTVIANDTGTATIMVQPQFKGNLSGVKATDNAGNQTTLEVTMKPIAALTEPAAGLDETNATSADKAALESARDSLERVLGGDAMTDEEKAALEEALEAYGGNLTDGEKQQMEEALGQVNGALESLERVEDAQGVIDALPDTVAPDDNDTIETIEAAKELFDRLTSHEKELLGDAAARDYKILAGDNGTFTKGGANGLTITANGAPERLTGLLLDGETIDKANYTIEKGSTVATLKPAYLNTLAAGAHTLTFVYKDGQVSATLTVTEAPDNDASATNSAVPPTGDSGAPVLWVCLLTAGALGLAARPWHRRRRGGGGAA